MGDPPPIGRGNLDWIATKVRGIEGLVPAAEDAIAYLAGLCGEVREHARDYIKKVPAQIDTPCRREIMTSLGWQ